MATKTPTTQQLSTVEETTLPAVIPAQSNDVMVPDFGDDVESYLGYEGIDTANFQIPRMVIVQHMSQTVGATPGFFRLNQTGEEFDSLDICILKAHDGRVLFDDDLSNNVVLCRSDDGKVPSEFIDPGEKDFKKKEGKEFISYREMFPPADKCVVSGILKGRPRKVPVCPKAVWRDNKVPPDCKETINMLCIEMTTLFPFWLSVHGMSLKPTFGTISRLANARKPLWKHHTTISLREVIEPGSKYFVTEYTAPTPIEPEMLQEIAEFVKIFGSMNIAEIYAAEEDAKRASMDSEDAIDVGQGGNGGKSGAGDMPSFMQQ